MTPVKLRPVKLTDIPLKDRLAAAQREAQHATETERLSLLAAALQPSDRTYWIAA